MTEWAIVDSEGLLHYASGDWFQIEGEYVVVYHTPTGDVVDSQPVGVFHRPRRVQRND